ncbi:MAG: hypothetical protein U0904_07340 [Candidatus Nanopelagicales bacterium]|nr:hypothetical protein [Candidatus Nanopelagicales bacterium]
MTAVVVSALLLGACSGAGDSDVRRNAGAQDPTDDVAGLIAKVAPDQPEVIAPSAEGKKLVAEAGDVTVSVPVNPDKAITLNPSSEGKSTALALKVNLPEEVSAGPGRVATDGTVVYEATGDGADAAVQVLQDGSVRLQTITPAPGGPDEFTYTFGEGVSPVSTKDGGIELLQDTGEVALTVGTVGQAWAVDANGTEVATKYKIEGDELIQTVTPGPGAVYPIVADPKITRAWWNTTVYFKRKETRRIGDGLTGLAMVAVAIPDPTIMKIVGAGAGLGWAYVRWIYSSGKCLKFVYVMNAANVWEPYGGDEAGGYCKKKKK